MRIQLLLLPCEEDDKGRLVEPFALVVDQFNEGLATNEDMDRDLPGWSKFALECGARSVLVTPQDVEVIPQVRQPIEVGEVSEGSERAQIVAMIRHYFAAAEDPLYEDVRILCGRIERGEHLPGSPAQPPTS